MRVLVTGGAGYIGSHTIVKLLLEGNEVCVADNLSNSSLSSLERAKQLTNRDILFYCVNLNDQDELNDCFEGFKPEAVIHFAGLKSVGESEEKPMEYFHQNVGGTINLLKSMTHYDCHKIVFSSSATVYGQPQYLPYDEDHPLNPMNAYGHTKLMAETVISNWVKTHNENAAALLRYFNPIGAHPSGHIGESPQGKPNNLMPYITQVAIGRRPYLEIFGNDYETIDGTGVRDYIHVMDLATGHIAALNFVSKNYGVDAFNLGTGVGASVMEIIDNFEKASGKNIKYKISARRAGDLPAFWANPEKAQKLLNWRAEKDLSQMCQDSWLWQSNNPQGYEDTE